MKRVFPIILTILLLAACMENRPARVAMEQAAALMDTRPDSALGILLALPEEDSAAMTKEQRMRWLLLRQQGMNKCDTVFRSDRIPLILVKWFDHHGTPNEQMLAHYLLGRAYADMGESPAALQEYYTAASCADTTAADCDFSTLSRVHGQAGGLFYEQYLPHNSQEEFEKAAYYSWRLGDSLSYYLYCGQLVGTYYPLGDPETPVYVNKPKVMHFPELSFMGNEMIVSSVPDSSLVCVMGLNGNDYYQIKTVRNNNTFVATPSLSSVCVCADGYIPFLLTSYCQDTIQNEIFNGNNVVNASNVVVGSDVTTDKPQGGVVVFDGETIIKGSNSVTIKNDFEVRKGALLTIN
ncbi:MAG: hypothetical protein IJ928_01815 [Prevotella sp.]|nr:hypothetical protein [Prevotella sp.]